MAVERHGRRIRRTEAARATALRALEHLTARPAPGLAGTAAARRCAATEQRAESGAQAGARQRSGARLACSMAVACDGLSARPARVASGARRYQAAYGVGSETSMR